MATKTIYHNMEGHYNAYWSFYGQVNGGNPSGFSEYGGDDYMHIRSYISEITPVHLDILDIHCTGIGTSYLFQYTNNSNSVLELYVYPKQTNKTLIFEVINDSFQQIAKFDIRNDGKFYNCNVDSTFSYSANILYRISFGWRKTGTAVLPGSFSDLAEGKSRLMVNSTSYGGDQNLIRDEVPFAFRIYVSNQNGGQWYLDAIGITGLGFGYSLGANLNYCDGVEFLATCYNGKVNRKVETHARASFTSTERIYEGELVKIYDENPTQEFYGKVDPKGCKFNGEYYNYACSGLEKSDLDAEVSIDYSSVATEISDIAEAAIDNVKTYVTYAAFAATGITIKIKFTRTPLRQVLTILGWRANAIWYVAPDGEIFFKLISALTNSAISLTEASAISQKILIYPNMSFTNAAYISGANGLEASDVATCADLIAQYGEQIWGGLTNFSCVSDQTQLNSFCTALLGIQGIHDPDKTRLELEYYDSLFFQEGKYLTISHASYAQLIVAKTPIIWEVEHDLCSKECWMSLSEIGAEVQSGFQLHEQKINALEELAGNASGDLKSNSVSLTMRPRNTDTAGANNCYWLADDMYIVFGTNSYDSSKYAVANFKLPSHYVTGSGFKLHLNLFPNGAGAKVLKYWIDAYSAFDGAASVLEQTVSGQWNETGNQWNYESVTITDASFTPNSCGHFIIYISDNAEAINIYALSDCWIQLL